MEFYKLLQKCFLYFFVSELFMLCSCFTYEDFIQMRLKGEYRKACSKYGVPPQPPARVNTRQRLEKLRQVMKNETITKGIILGAYFITSNDEHQTEYVAEYDRRREYISGFSGTYGDAIVTLDKAILWTDGRYHLQADDQLDCNWLLLRIGHANISTPTEWLKEQFPNGTIVGVDPKLIAQSTWRDMRYELQGSNITLVAIDNNLIDAIWTVNRPPKRNKDVFLLEEKYSGKAWVDKVRELRQILNESKVDAMVVTALDEIAWLLNIRGRDIPFNPFVRSYVIVDMYNVKFFVNQSQLYKHNIYKHFNETRTESKYHVRFLNYEDICENLKILSQAYHKVLIPSQCSGSPGASRFIYQCVPEGKRQPQHSPIIYLKAKKNPTEIKGMQQAHIRDAAAMCEFFSYFESRAGTTFTELDVVKILNEFRFEQEFSLGNSFKTIAAFGPNGAQPHYEPTPSTNVKIFDNSTLVLDSGGQYYAPISMHFGEVTGFSDTEYLKPGYFLSNEPGFYKENDFGIRLENVLEVVNKPWLRHTSGHAFLGFRVVTLVPYDMKLIDLSLLSVQHRRWLNSYNARIRSNVGSELKRQNLMSGFYWMMDNTADIPLYGHSTLHKGQSLIVLICVASFLKILN